MVLAGLLLVLAAAGALPGAGAAPQPIALAAYVARLDAARQLAEADAAHPSVAAMASVRRALGLPLDVSVAGRTQHIGDDPVLAALHGTSRDDFLQAADHLAGLEDTARAAAATQPPGAARLRAALAGAYQGITAQPSLTDRLRHDAWVILRSLWQHLTDLTGGSLVFGILLAAAVIAVVVVVLRRTGAVVSGKGQAPAAPRGRARAVDWDRVAEEALARGDLDGAVRARFRALLAALAARGVIPDAPSLTAGECRRAVAAHLPDAYPAVARAASIFESTVYGRAPANLGEVDAVAEAERTVRAA